jgi:hypothetical protein
MLMSKLSSALIVVRSYRFRLDLPIVSIRQRKTKIVRAEKTP